MSPAASSRWCPTPEQLMILEEMYRGGVRTPNASQIQQITAHLSFYGKIEGKNVFYWFQNHKARDRQKLRRKLSKQLQLQQQQQQQFHHHHHHHQPVLVQQQQQQNHQHNHRLLHYLDPPIYSAVHQLFNYNTSPFLPHQGGVGDQEQAAYGWKNVEEWGGGGGGGGGGERSEKEKSMMRMYSHEWMMMMEMEMRPSSPGGTSPNPCCSNNNSRPLKTLQLFPISATSNIKEDTTTTA